MKNWIVGIGTALVLSLSGWTGNAFVEQGQRISRLEGELGYIKSALERIEQKLDNLKSTEEMTNGRS